MAVTPPSAIVTTDVDASGDNPQLARAVVLTTATSFNTLLGQYNSLGIMQPGDGVEQFAAAGGTKDYLRVKLDGSSLARSASGIKIAATGITLAMLAQNGATNGQVMSWNGSAWVVSSPATGGNQKLKKSVVTTTGVTNFTVPTGVTEVKVTCVAGGGGGGTAGAGTNHSVGGGGGGGGTAIAWVTGLTPGATVECSVGSEGTLTRFGTAGSPYCRAQPGASGGGITSPGITTAAAVAGGSGGAGDLPASGGLLIRGQDGSPGYIYGISGLGGTGGSSSLGGGGKGGASNAGSVAGGASGGNYGGGGGGGCKANNSGTAGGGGGAQGVIIIEWVEA